MQAVEFQCDLSEVTRRLPHFWEHTVGSCHAAMTLRADWQAQMRRCHQELGFRHVRFHAILSDDMGTLLKEEDRLRYSFFNADQIWDFLLSIGMKPFVELSFMPTALASGDTTVFKYQANVTPPQNLKEWSTLIDKLVSHWVQRYGIEEVRTWYFEVWNEPNLKAFWTCSQEKYFELYRATVQTIKDVDPNLRVGGPATASDHWIGEFVDFCENNGLPVDFISTHHYPTDALGTAQEDTLSQLAQSQRSRLRERAQDTRRRARGKPLYYTEWNSSSNPRDPLHDEPYTAAVVVKTMMEANGLVDGYSFWTFSDIFAENYFPAEPFQGGFGLLTLNGIAKPSYRAFELLHRLGVEQCLVDGLHETVDAWVVRRAGGVTVLLSNHALPRHAIATERVHVRLIGAPAVDNVYVERIDDDHANAKKQWLHLGKPQFPTEHEVEQLGAASRLVREPQEWSCKDGSVHLELALPPEGIAAVTLEFARASGAGGDGDSKKMKPTPDLLDVVQRETFDFFLHEANPANGLVVDNSKEDSPGSIAAVGLALTAYPVGVERGYIARAEAVQRTLATLRFFRKSHQGTEPKATGYKGFYYHFLDMKTGKRVQQCELSTIDTAFLLAGMLTARAYFQNDSADEQEIRALADELYRRADWRWAQNGQPGVSLGWTPENGFLPHTWKGYDEALIVYLLALGSPSHAIPSGSYQAWTSGYQWKKIYDHELLHSGPLFTHQISHLWVDFRGIQDEYMRGKCIDYFENSRRATYVQQQYAIHNPGQFEMYGENCWGITACDGPGPAQIKVNGKERQFYGYEARGVPDGPDDGTIAPFAVVASLPFAPEIVLPAIRQFDELDLQAPNPYGFKATFNPTFPNESRERFWICPWHYALNQGPIVVMIENYRSGLPWRLMRRCSYLIEGLRRAGFTGGWLEGART